jgi:taurine--2-oxoglutarate transaminase
VARHTFGTWRVQGGWRPLVVERAEGVHFWDDAGRRYLDMSAQLMCVNLGHGNVAVAEAMARQARELAFVAPAYGTRVRAELALKLLGVVPPGIEKFFFATSGTEAVEAAIKMARLVTGRHKIIARYASYHGSTAGSLGATGDWRRWAAEPLHGTVSGVIHGPECHPYRDGEQGPWGLCGVEYYDHILRHEANVAAILVEPVVGTNGVLVPPDGYLQRLQEIARSHGALFICDEVMCGWGRTGRWFALEHWDLRPDIVVTAKGVTNAMAPLGVVGVTRAVADHFETNLFPHGHTYESHPVTLAAAVAAIDEYRRLELLPRARTMGEKLGARLAGLMARHPSVGDVRGLGLFWAIDLVKDRRTRAPFNTMHDKAANRPLMVERVAAELMKRGVAMVPWVSHLVVAPPLIVSEADLDEAIEALDSALLVADEQVVRA